jgi:hypothetical protein
MVIARLDRAIQGFPFYEKREKETPGFPAFAGNDG